jgi:hypothetical protein
MTAPSFDLIHLRRLLDSYQRWMQRDLIERSANFALEAERLFHAPFVVVSHGTQADPIFCYGNALALQLWELTWAELTSMPSRLTAEPMHRDERAQLLARTTRDGYVDDYRGIRISKSGRRFRIDQAIVWNVLDEAGNYAGQAATFSQWEYL